MNTLYLCEKPAQAKVLAKHLGITRFSGGVWRGDEVAVVAARGHLIELSLMEQYIGAKNWSLDDLPVLPQGWALKVKEDQRSTELFNLIGELFNEASHLVIATDPDEEGELIARDLAYWHDFTGVVSRLWLSALDSDGLTNALNNLQPMGAMDRYYLSGDIRRKLDWLFGMNLSRAFSVKFGSTTPIGRVKTRLLAELMRRENAIAQFKPTFYHSVKAKIMGCEEFYYMSGHPPELFGEYKVESLYDLIDMRGTITSVIEDTIEIAPPLPYCLSTLLVDAALSGIGLSDGYSATQALYEAGAISYPRTSSTELPQRGNKAFAAHSAIFITGELPDSATSAMVGIYNLVKQNLQMQKLGNAKINRRTVLVNVLEHIFKLHEQQLLTEGFIPMLQPWHPAYGKYPEIKKETCRKQYKVGAEHIVTGVHLDKLVTIAPQPYTEASMLKMMLENEIGTESTRVNSIKSLVRDGMALVNAPIDGRGSAILRATARAKKVAAQLPPSVLGNEMTTLVKSAQQAAQNGDENLDRFLVEGLKWLLKVIPVSA